MCVVPNIPSAEQTKKLMQNVNMIRLTKSTYW